MPIQKSKIQKPTSRKSPDQSLKETAESVVVAFILAFIFRAYIVEAFVIPTGSMAPTLLGQHVRADCPQCDYRFATDGGERSTAGVDLRCPMCFFPIRTLDDAGQPNRTYAGDRILVQKYLYRFAEPRRYDVVVFKNPESPDTNFIKRLVGLPNESLGFLDGNLYRKSTTRGDWEIASKVDPEVNPRWEAIQRDVFQPIYHSRYVPRDHGDSEARRGMGWAQPWKPVAGDWEVTHDEQRGAIFRFGSDSQNTPQPQVNDQRVPDNNVGTLRFDFRPTAGYRTDYADDFARYAYNQPNGSGPTLNWLEDLRVAATIRLPRFRESSDGSPHTDISVAFGSRVRFDSAAEPVSARIVSEGESHRVELIRRADEVLASASLSGPPFPLGQAVAAEFWFVDQTFLVFLDGEEVLRHELQIPFDQLLDRPAPPTPSQQQIEITVTGGPATLTDLQLDRDLVYDDGGLVDRQRAAFPRDYQGNLSRRDANPIDLGPDQFFCVGDNSPASQDSRKWASVNRDVADAHFDGDRGPNSQGRVPRDLLMGRAFFVYYPAPSPVTAAGPAVIPNFGEMRFIH